MKTKKYKIRFMNQWSKSIRFVLFEIYITKTSGWIEIFNFKLMWSDPIAEEYKMFDEFFGEMDK